MAKSHMWARTAFLVLAAALAFTLAPASVQGREAGRDRTEVLEFVLEDGYAGLEAGPDGLLDVRAFQDESVYRVSEVGTPSPAGMALGSTARTSEFNGILMGRFSSGDKAAEQAAVEAAKAAYLSFDREHPEVFWLGSEYKLRIETWKDGATGAKTSYLFLVLADRDGYAMLSPAWRTPGGIAEGIARREAAIGRILATVTAPDTYGRARQLNKWLVEHNQYNTSPDLLAIGNEPHECLSALEGRIGTEGPVCSGYSRAFKVLCDRLGVPCELATGSAVAVPGGAPVLHMWDLVRAGDGWYAVDVTWNDPGVDGVTAAVSRRENENYLMVGSGTVVNGQAFGLSHAADPGGPALSPAAYGSQDAPFKDVPTGAYYRDAVAWAVGRGIVAGTGGGMFSPNAPCTRTQILAFLWRAVGSPAAGPLPDGATVPAWAEGAVRWAYGAGVVTDGTDLSAPCTRADAVEYMWRAAGSPAASGAAFADVPTDSGYAQAVAWAVRSGVTSGTGDGMFSPDMACTRAQIATLLYRGLA